MSAIRSDSLDEGVVSVSGNDALNEKTTINVTSKGDHQLTTTSIGSGEIGYENDRNSDDVIIVDGVDAANHLLPMRDDGDPALTFRSLILASGLACFQAVMYQIYMVCDYSLKLIALELTDRCVVQTYRHYHPRNFHCSYFVLRWPSLGQVPSPWREVRGSMEGIGRPGKASYAYHNP